MTRSRSSEFVVGHSPIPEVQAGAASYRKTNGFLAPEQDYSRSVIPGSQTRHIGREYMHMPTYSRSAEPAYHAMAEETGRQFDHLTGPRSKGGMGISVSVSDEDPYGWRGEEPKGDYSNYHWDSVVPELRNDLQNNHHITVLSTKSTGGHPLLTNDQNDMFRAVHDVFGHMGSGRGVDRHGEDAAYQKHAGMFSGLARGAMATETRGQNAALHLNNGVFQEQKVGILPAHMRTTRNLSSLQFGHGPDEMHEARETAREKNRQQGIADH